ncbi:hypothetical protein H6P81_010569 [Aristolochia fimbriata]|uniref:Cotton fiber protein n=1 Tax=Aristolochia fimbriata TaxID=158543 RepID=A0AAV7EPS2_ARIFI|nr:hypothetical protein H6P81_010569 [Aristolochia fimbriata]
MLQKSRLKYPAGMSQKRPPIFRKAWDLIALSIPIDKLQKPIKQNLLTFKRARKNKRKLLKYYEYAFIEEFQFSPSSTPLFRRYKRQLKKTSAWSLSSMLLLCHCSRAPTIEAFQSLDDDDSTDPIVENDFPREPESTYSSDESESVDRRAERFIARFYEDMRMQRQASLMLK